MTVSESSDPGGFEGTAYPQPARLGRRLLARIIDWISYSIVGFCLVFSSTIWLGLLTGFVGMGGWDTKPGVALIWIEKLTLPDSVRLVPVYFSYLIVVSGLVVVFLYELPLTALRGQTVGKMLTDVRVARVKDEGTPGWGPSCIRWAVLYVPLLAPFGPLLTVLVAVSPIFDASRRGWHDKIAGTIVVDRSSRQGRGALNGAGDREVADLV